MADTSPSKDQAKEELAKARKQQGAWYMSAATLRLTKLCMP